MVLTQVPGIGRLSCINGSVFENVVFVSIVNGGSEATEFTVLTRDEEAASWQTLGEGFSEELNGVEASEDRTASDRILLLQFKSWSPAATGIMFCGVIPEYGEAGVKPHSGCCSC